jgi:hypothetical protein
MLVRARKAETETSSLGLLELPGPALRILNLDMVRDYRRVTLQRSDRRCTAVSRRSARIFVKVKDRAKNSARTHGGSAPRLENHAWHTDSILRAIARSNRLPGNIPGKIRVTLHVALIEIIVEDVGKKTENNRRDPATGRALLFLAVATRRGKTIRAKE